MPTLARSSRWIAPAVAVGLVLALFAPTLLELLHVWDTDPSYSHGYLILPLSLWLAWRAAGDASPGRGQVALGSLYLLAGAVFHLGTRVFGWPLLDFAALALVLRGLAVAAGGREWAGRFTFPIVFLFFMFPLPDGWTARAAVWLQDIVSRVSAEVFDLFLVCMRKGNALHIAGVSEPLHVAEECSGLRQIVAFVALGALLGHLSGGRPMARVLLLLAAVPVAILANVIRVLLMGFGAYLFGTEWIAGPLHSAPALVSLPIGMLIYFLLWKLIRAEASPEATPTPGADTAPAAGPATRPVLAFCGLLALVLAADRAVLGHLAVVDERELPTLRDPLADLPADFETADVMWTSKEHPGRAALAAQVPFADEFIYRAYWPVRGESVGPPAVVYAVYSRAGEDRKHHPEVCVRDVNGAPEDASMRAILHLDGDASRPVQRFRFLTGPRGSTVIYYWHYTLAPPGMEGASLLQDLHARHARETPSVTVQVSTNATGEELEQIEASLLPTLDATLRARQLPETARMGCDRVPIQVLATR